MSAGNNPVRVPFARIQANDVDDQKTQRALTTVDQNFQRIERYSAGSYQPQTLTAGRSPYQVKATDWMLLVDASGDAVSIVFPMAARLDGLNVRVVKTDASANQVTLVATISGVLNPVLAVQFAEVTVDAGNGVYYSSQVPPGGLVASKYRITTTGLFRVTTTGAFRILTNGS